MRSIERRDTGESYEAFVRSLAEASGVETPTRADLARFDRSRKNKKTSNGVVNRRAPGGANVDGLQAVAPHPPGQVAHEGARRVANRGGAHRALQHGGEEGAEELVRDGPQLLFALLRFLCRPGRWSTRLKLQRPPEGSAQVDGNVAKIDLAARGVDGALVHFNAPSWAVRAVMSSTTLPVCPKTGSTSPSLTVHLCLHTALLREIGMRPSRTRRRIDVETHEAVFTWILERLSAAGLVRGKTVGIDATTLEANAAMRSIERRDTGESYEAFVRSLAEASGVETPTRADLARFDRSRKNKKTSNKEWKSPQDPDAKVAKMKDGRTHLAHKAEHGVDMDTGAIVAVTVQDASDGDTATLPATLIMAAEQVEAVQPNGVGVEEVVADQGYHSDETLVALGAVGVRSHVSEPERGRRCWQDKKTGETPPEKRAAQKALYANRRRVRGRRGRRLQRCRGEVVERTFAHMYETGGMRRVWVRGHENVRKRVLLQAAACNIGLLLRSQTGIGTPRSLQGRAVSAICRLIGRLIDRWGRLTRAWGFKWTPTALAGSIPHRQAA